MSAYTGKVFLMKWGTLALTTTGFCGYVPSVFGKPGPSIVMCRVEIYRMRLAGVTCISPSHLTWAQNLRATMKQEQPLAQRRSWAMLHVHDRGQCWSRLELTTHSQGRVSTCCTFMIESYKSCCWALWFQVFISWTNSNCKVDCLQGQWGTLSSN